MDMSLSKLQELVIDRVAYRVAVHEVTEHLWKWCTRKCIISFLWNFYQKCMTWVRTWRIIWWTLFGAPAIGFKACLLETTGIRKGNPLQYACMENSMDRGGLWATVHGVSKRWTRLSDWAQAPLNLSKTHKTGKHWGTNSGWKNQKRADS